MTKPHAMQCRKVLTDFVIIQGVKTFPSPKRKKMKQIHVLGIGWYHPNKCKVMHIDGATTDDVEAGSISK